MKTYRPSTILLILEVLLDISLMCILVGFILLPYHLLKYLRQSLTLEEKSVTLNIGLLSTSTHEIPYSKINSVTVRKGFLGSILGYGTIVIFTGNDSTGLLFKNIEGPEKIVREINAKIQE